ncbi:MAG: protein-export chaperone SecB [Gammaproteobacteria bacterium]|nr:protein-export chaperone SecB [Gammaproteobacteria bacterium]
MEQDQQENIVFNIEKIYIKDISYEAPSVPMTFVQAQDGAAEIGVQLGLEHGALNAEHGIYEVALTVTATANRESKTIFLVEVKQAGIFRINGIEGETLQRTLQISCAYVLLPFVRETINELVGKGGFPQLLINPINFEALYEQKQVGQANPPSIN